MEIFEKRRIKIPNEVFIQDVTKSETNDEVLEFLKQYGSILKFELDEPDSVFHHSIVVEYNSVAALLTLRPLLPYTYVCNDVCATYEILDLSSVCADEVCKLQTENYISELKKVAKSIGQDVTVFLNVVMSLLGQSPSSSPPPLKSSLQRTKETSRRPLLMLASRIPQLNTPQANLCQPCHMQT